MNANTNAKPATLCANSDIMKMIGLIVFFFSLGIKSAFNQTPLSKEQILELYKSCESQKKQVLEFSDADSLLNMSLAHSDVRILEISSDTLDFFQSNTNYCK